MCPQVALKRHFGACARSERQTKQARNLFPQLCLALTLLQTGNTESLSIGSRL